MRTRVRAHPRYEVDDGRTPVGVLKLKPGFDDSLDVLTEQRATDKLLALLCQLGPAAGWALRLPGALRVVRASSAILDVGLLGD